MKKLTFQLSLWYLILALLFFACQNQENVQGTSNGNGEKENFGEFERSREIVVRFEETTSDSIKNEVLTDLQDSFALVKHCHCNQDIYLFEALSNINPAERVAAAEDDVRESGDVGRNFDLSLEDIFENYQADVRPETFSSHGYSTPLVIAVVDAGINASSDYFLPHLWINPGEAESNSFDNLDNDGNCFIDDVYGYDFTDGTPHGTNPNLNSHGNMVASVMIQKLENEIEFELMDLKVFNHEGKGLLFDALCAIDYAIDNKAKVINLSWEYSHSEPDPVLIKLLRKAEQQEILVVSAAGNDTADVDVEFHYPAALTDSVSNLVSVAALNDSLKSLANFSNYGDQTITLAAPGEDITVFQFDGNTPIENEGTSFAAPYVSSALGYMVWHDGFSKSPSDYINCLDSNLITLTGLQVKTSGKIEDINFQISSCPQ